MSALPQLYPKSEIEIEVDNDDFRMSLIDGISEGFLSFHRGRFNAPPIQTMGAPPMAPFCQDPDYAAQTCVKSGYFDGNPFYVIKVASGGHPLPNSGSMQIYSQKTGKLEAILLDDGLLTDLRTAAVGALAAKLLAPKTVQKIGIVGTGAQARFQLEFLSLVVPCQDVVVWGRNLMSAREFAEEYSHLNVQVVKDADQLLRECDIIVTTTPARIPVLGNSGYVPTKGCLIICIGSDAPGKGELNINLIQKADYRVADAIEQTVVRGEFQKFARVKENRESIYSLGEVIDDPELHRKDGDQRVIIFDSSGVALQDCVIAQMVYESLQVNESLK